MMILFIIAYCKRGASRPLSSLTQLSGPLESPSDTNKLQFGEHELTNLHGISQVKKAFDD